MQTKPIAVVLVCITAVSATVFFMNACTSQGRLDSADVNPAFAQNPPLAEEITIRELEKAVDSGNVLVTTRLTGVTTRLHAVMVGDEKMTLRDDGNGGDETAGDGIFSIILQEDLGAFTNAIQVTQQKNLSLLQGRPLVKFVNRHAVPVATNQFRELRFDSNAIRRGIRLPLDFFTLAPDPALKDHSLMITETGVVKDPGRTFLFCEPASGTANGAWTFSRLVTDMANSAATGVTAEDFVKNWLDSWMNPVNINGDDVPSRPAIFDLVIRPWIIRTTPGSNPTASNWKTFALNLSMAPFKLEAIVNRLDLRGNIGYSVSNAGEGRFVFSVTNSNCNPIQNPGKFTVIFEYGIPKNSCSSLKAFAQQWYDLKNLVPGGSAYNAALETITNQFAGVNAKPSAPNGSALNQIRTNEFALGGEFWELREFRIDTVSHQLKQTTIANEPAEKFNRLANGNTTNQAILANYVNSFQNDIIAQKHSVPADFSGPFRGARAQTRTPDHFWDGSVTTGSSFIISDSARHFMSLNTCSGCHGGEGATSRGNLIGNPSGVFHNPFLQIAPQNNGVKATLAGFITGDPAQPDKSLKVTDPANRPTGTAAVWSFNDLDNRAQSLEELVNRSCKGLLGLIHVLRFKPLNMVH